MGVLSEEHIKWHKDCNEVFFCVLTVKLLELLPVSATGVSLESIITQKIYKVMQGTT